MIARNLTAILCLIALSCSTGAIRRNNTTRAQFLDQMWVAPSLRGKAPSDLYHSVYFAPTTTGHLKKQDWWTSQSYKTRAELDRDAEHLAGYMHCSMVHAAQTRPGKRVQVVGRPGPGTLVVETSINELVPAKAFWNATATTAGFVIPGAGLLSAAGSGSVGFEGRVRDGATGEVIATFRHRMTDKTTLVNVNSYKWYGGSEANIDELSGKVAEILNAPAGTVVNRASQYGVASY